MKRFLLLAFLGCALLGLPASASADEKPQKRFPTVAADQSRTIEIVKLPIVLHRDLEPAPGTTAKCIQQGPPIMAHLCQIDFCRPSRRFCCAFCYQDPFLCVASSCV